jgi:hypothetical protein
MAASAFKGHDLALPIRLLTPPMRTNLPSLLTATVVALAAWQPMPVEAGVVYRWFNTSVNTTAGALEGELVVRDSAWFNGMTLQQSSHAGPYPAAPTALESFWFKGQGLTLNYNGDTPPAFGFFSLDITLTSVITGQWLEFNTSAEDVRMSTNALNSPVWTIQHLGTDFDGSPCHHADTCSGGSGYWALDLSTLPVSSPGSLPLLALGLLALMWRVRPNHRLDARVPTAA